MGRKQILTIVSLLLAAAAVVVGTVVLHDRSYYLITAVILLVALLPFAALFRRRGVKARELVTVATMTAIAVASRGAFYMLPAVKPLCGIAIITGVALGEEIGFVVGALSMFLSNFLFGQGAWTPFQVFGMGLAVLVASWILRRGTLRDNRVVSAFVGGLCCFLLYGGVADSCAVLAMAPDFTWKSVTAILLSGLPFNAIHGGMTALTIFFLGKGIGEKLERMCKKYGLFAEITETETDT
jgi:uncharacterized membrane protein